MLSSKSSRYSSLFDNDKNKEARTIAERVITKSQPYFTHVTESNESFSSLAAKYLNNEKLYWYIADQTPQNSRLDSRHSWLVATHSDRH